jgi:class 3 adenylate cyclase
VKTQAIERIVNSFDTMQFSTDRLATDFLDVLARLEDAAIQKRLLQELIGKYVELEKRVDGLLRNTLPESVADEIKFNSEYPPRAFAGTIFFSDCAGFTRLAEKMSAEVLIERLHLLFSGTDKIMARHGGTKIKTIGDSYMACFGAPIAQAEHARRAIDAALDVIEFLREFNAGQPLPIEMRIGIHSGKFIGGVVGKDRMQFDIFGDTVNTASRFESSGEKGRVNISGDTFEQVIKYFNFESRGEISLKNKDPMKAYFVTGRQKEAAR